MKDYKIFRNLYIFEKVLRRISQESYAFTEKLSYYRTGVSGE